MNPELDTILQTADTVLNTSEPIDYQGPIHVGADLGTAYTVLIVLDEHYRPLAGRYQFAQIVRDGLIVDFIGAIRLLSKMKQELEAQLGITLEHAATSYPPGVAMAEVKATRQISVLNRRLISCR
jgi:ethanolamine utilization protein EutJ